MKLHRQRADSAATEESQNAYAAIQPETCEPRASHRMFRLWLPGICGIVVILGGALLGCSPSPSGTGEANVPAKAVAPAVVSTVVRVSMKTIQFDPATVEVKRGDTVEWKNDDLVPHTATSTSLNSGPMASGQSWRHTFTDAGEFPYACTFHPQMKGVVIVK